MEYQRLLAAHMVNVAILVLCQAVAYCELIPLRIPKKKGYLGIITFSMLLYCLYLYLVYHFSFPTMNKYQLLFFTLPPFAVVFSMARHRNGKTIFLFYFINFIIDTCDMIGFLIVFFTGLQHYAWLHIGIRSGLVTLSTLGLILWVFPKLERIYETQKSAWIPVTVSTVLAALFIYYITSFPTPLGKRPEDFPLVAFANLTVVVNYMIVILTVLNQNKLEKKEIQVSTLETELDISHMLLQQGERQYVTILDTYEQIRRMRHDLHHHLVMVDGLNEQGKPDQLRAYLRKLAASIPDVPIIHYCNSFEINLLLAHYWELCRQDRIQFSCVMNLGDIELLKPVHLCVFLGNALENALEACQKMAHTAERFIKIKGSNVNRAIVLDISNSYDGLVKLDVHGNYISTKTNDGQHGFGLRSMKQIIAENQGWCEIQYTEAVFTIQATLQI